MMSKMFCETLDDVDMTIFHMRLQGHTHAEIAVKLGYKNHMVVFGTPDWFRSNSFQGVSD